MSFDVKIIILLEYIFNLGK